MDSSINILRMQEMRRIMVDEGTIIKQSENNQSQKVRIPTEFRIRQRKD